MDETLETKPLASRVEGSGEPVVLLNGGLMSISAWEPVAAALAARYKVVRCDLRGQLLSPGVPEPTVEAHVRDVVGMLDGLGLGRVHLVGTSYGSFVALRLAALHPERAASVAVLAGTERITPESWAATAELLGLVEAAIQGEDGGRVLDFLLPGTYTPAYLESQKEVLGFHRKWVAGLPAVWYRGLVPLLASLEGLDLTPHLGEVECPVLVVCAEEDRMFPPERSRALAAAIPDARLVVVPGAPHGIVMEQPDATIRLLLDFLPNGSRPNGQTGDPNAS